MQSPIWVIFHWIFTTIPITNFSIWLRILKSRSKECLFNDFADIFFKGTKNIPFWIHSHFCQHPPGWRWPKNYILYIYWNHSEFSFFFLQCWLWGIVRVIKVEYFFTELDAMRSIKPMLQYGGLCLFSYI